MAGFGLQQKEQITVLLGTFIIREETLLRVGSIIKMAGDFVLLLRRSFVSHCLSLHPFSLSARKGTIPQDLPPPEPSDSESTVLSVNQGIVHPFLARNSSLTAKKSSTSILSNVSALHKESVTQSEQSGEKVPGLTSSQVI